MYCMYRMCYVLFYVLYVLKGIVVRKEGVVMKYCLSVFLAVLFLAAALCSTVMYGTAEAADDAWYWISSDNNYTKYYDTSKVKVQESFEGIATRITALTKTTYSYGGAKETLDNYGITDIVPNNLAYSLATVQVCPQTRVLAYVDEAFYDKNGKVLWSKQYQPLKYKEMNSQEFDEDFYAYIVDSVFGLGEVERRSASDRWLLLWQDRLKEGGYVNCMADTTTMRANGENIIFWEWQEYKAADGAIIEIRFLKKSVNIPQSTAKIVRYQHWNAKEGWQDYTDRETDGAYYAVEQGTNDEKELNQLSAYAKNHKQWVYRYNLDYQENASSYVNDNYGI